MVYEIRNYHYEPAKFDAYKEWATREAVPVLKQNLDVVGFWLNSSDAPEYKGSAQMDLPLGPSNVTWIIRWDSMQARVDGWKRLSQNADWQAAWSKHPDANGYLQIEVKFADGL